MEEGLEQEALGLAGARELEGSELEQVTYQEVSDFRLSTSAYLHDT